MTVDIPATSSSTAVDVPVVVEPVVEAPVVEAPVVATQTYVPGPIGIIPPDAPGGEKVPERSEGIMATLAKRRTKNAVPPVAVVVVEEPVVTPPAKVEYVNVPPVVVPETVVQPVEEPKPSASVAAELSLYVDCYPEKAEFDSLRALEDEIAARTPSLLEHLRKTSPKDVPEGTMDLGEVLYGRGYSTLAASFALKPISGPYTVSTLGPASSKVLEVLLPKATFVVRGRR